MVNQYYDVGKELGSGAFSKVYLAKDKSTGEKVALKMIKAAVFMKNRESTLRESKILQEVSKSKDNTHVVRLYRTLEDKQFYTIAMEVLTGGELYHRICEKDKYNETSAKMIVKQLLSAVAFLHEKDIAHRDIKPENVLFVSEDEDSDIKLTDFGFANFYSPSNKFVAACGTPLYVAPEILERRAYDCQCDIWSLGVVVYIMLCGYPPFYGEEEEELYYRIKHAYYDFISPHWDHISDNAKDFIQNCFQLDPSKRIKAKDALKHKWFDAVEKEEHNLAIVQENMKRTIFKRKLIKGVYAVIAMQRLSRILEVEMQKLITVEAEAAFDQRL